MVTIMECQDARLLILPYLDLELTEAQAAPLRQHLIECRSCRSEAQADKALDAWFVPTAEIQVPADFAARVARRAVAGDTGGRFETAGRGSANEVVEGGGRILPFVLNLTAAAALVLFLVSLAVKFQGNPSGEALQADSSNLSEMLDELDQLNRDQAADPTEGVVLPKADHDRGTDR